MLQVPYQFPGLVQGPGTPPGSLPPPFIMTGGGASAGSLPPSLMSGMPGLLQGGGGVRAGQLLLSRPPPNMPPNCCMVTTANGLQPAFFSGPIQSHPGVNPASGNFSGLSGSHPGNLLQFPGAGATSLPASLPASLPPRHLNTPPTARVADVNFHGGENNPRLLTQPGPGLLPPPSYPLHQPPFHTITPHQYYDDLQYNYDCQYHHYYGY